MADHAAGPPADPVVVGDLMTTEVVTVAEGTPAREVAELLIRHRISSVPVLDGRGALVGLVSEADLLCGPASPEDRLHRGRALLAEASAGAGIGWSVRAEGLTAGDVMSVEPVTVDPRTSVRTAARLMLEASVSQLPVVWRGRLVGLLARRDVLSTFLRSDVELAADVTAQLLVDPVAGACEVAASVEAGEVVLDGTVRDEHDAEALRRSVERLSGVVHVEDHVTVRHPES